MSEDNTALQAITNQTPAQFKKNHQELITFVKSQLKEAKQGKNNAGYDTLTSGDYGIIPRTTKKSLLKPGAEKLLKLFGFTAKMELVKEIEDWDKHFIYYRYKCTITHAPSGIFISDAVRSCNNKEAKHARKDVYDVANTIEAIAQKRALIAATVQATMASEIFDADVSENDEKAPDAPVTKEEDPRRVRIFSGLYGKAVARGLDNNWLHGAAIKRYKISKSLTELSNEQLEEFTELIIEHYEEVPRGSKPKRRANFSAPGEVDGLNTGEIMEAQLFERLKPGINKEEVDINEVAKALGDEE